MPFRFARHRELPEIVFVEPLALEDDRGSFQEVYKKSEFAQAGIATEFVQDDHSTSARRWVLRGLHFQVPPAAQGNLVRCARGEIFDVVVDIRPGSPQYRRWAAIVLSSSDQRMVWVPPGFAHGFLTLSDGAEICYKHTAEYSPRHARRIRWDDPSLRIEWPLGGVSPILSASDAAAPLLNELDPTV